MSIQKIFLFLSLVLLVSCVTNHSTGGNPPKNVKLSVVSGSIVVHAKSQITKNQEYTMTNPFEEKKEDQYYQENRATLERGSVLFDDILELSAGEFFEYSLTSSEVITFNITSKSPEGVSTLVLEDGGKIQNYSASNKSLLGLLISASN